MLPYRTRLNTALGISLGSILLAMREGPVAAPSLVFETITRGASNSFRHEEGSLRLPDADLRLVPGLRVQREWFEDGASLLGSPTASAVPSGAGAWIIEVRADDISDPDSYPTFYFTLELAIDADSEPPGFVATCGWGGSDMATIIGYANGELIIAPPDPGEPLTGTVWLDCMPDHESKEPLHCRFHLMRKDKPYDFEIVGEVRVPIAVGR